ncbi:carotenoid biosynthesis protein [Nocardia sp. BMG111209]|uniref:carotenoid biosynthesis protein n=1 Tax=Nocardia sp. BMG111209 TaxID=1160137 RepID=UPI00039E6C30|nr:carotenoid biosynthesis protein [Nocardia sp. BMG111209]
MAAADMARTAEATRVIASARPVEVLGKGGRGRWGDLVRWGPAGLVGVWVLAQIAYPLTAGAGRDAVTVVVVLLAAGIAGWHAWVSGGVWRVAGLLVVVAGVGLVAEIVGTAWGFPFGCYRYAAARLGPEVAGVPLVVPLAWVGGWYPVRVVAGRLSRRAGVRVVLTAVGAVGWDLFLDPQMVADGQWVWCSAWRGLPGLAGIPFTNFLGWFGVALVMAGLWEVVDRRGAREGGVDGPRWASADERSAARTDERLVGGGDGRPWTGTDERLTAAADERLGAGVGGWPGAGVDLLAAVPVGMFLWTWLGSALAHAVFLHLPWSAAYGFAGMGVLGVPLVWSLAGFRRT